MTSSLHVVFIWMHILGIALFVGPQFFLAYGWVPASRKIADVPTRLEAMRTITRRFAWMGGAGLLLIVVAGVYLVGSWRTYYHLDDGASFLSYRYGVIFIVKMCLLAVMLAAVGLHTFLVGPRLIDALERESLGQASAADVRRHRVYSMSLSIGGLALALAIMVLGAMLNTSSYSVIEF